MKLVVFISLALSVCSPAQDAITFLRGEVNGVHAGNHYEVRVTRAGGERVQSEDVMVSTTSFPLSIQLPEGAITKPKEEGGAISMYRLQHQVSAKAMNEFKKAEQAWSAGKKTESIERLQHVLKLDPGYVEAHNNPGTKLLVNGEMARASEEFRKSLELDANSAPSHLNLAICLLVDPNNRELAKEAEDHARKALHLDSSLPSVRYVLGMAMSWLNKEEALPYLRSSAEQFPRARVAAANMLERMGRKQEAREWRAQMQAGEDASNVK